MALVFIPERNRINVAISRAQCLAVVAEAAAPRVLEDYCDAIQILREKKFTFREIAEWLGKNFGIQADHNSVWLAHTKYMDDFTAHMEAKEDEELERDEALAEAEAKGTLRVLPHDRVPATEATVAEKAQTEIPQAASRAPESGSRSERRKTTAGTVEPTPCFFCEIDGRDPQ